MAFLTEPAPERGIALPVIPGISRIVAANPSLMTYHGTNTYLIKAEGGFVVLDPGPDFTKTPAQTVEALRHLADLNPSSQPMLLAISRKDFIGALTHTRPKERLAGTLAAVAAVGSGTGVILRVHDVGEVRRFLTVLDVLRSSDPVDPDLRLVDELRWAAGRPDGTTAV